MRLTDANDPLEAARVIKTADERELLKQSAAVCKAALFDLAEAIRPGFSEHELLGALYHKMLSLDPRRVTLMEPRFLSYDA